MCPFDMTMVKAVSYLSNFLPTFNTQAVKDQTYGLWFDELVSSVLYKLVQRAPKIQKKSKGKNS